MSDDANAPGDGIPLASLPNLRELGGWAAADGRRVRRGVLYRSTALGKLEPADEAELARRGIRTVYDLRTKAERDAEPDRTVDGAVEIALDALADANTAVPAGLFVLMQNVPAANAVLEDGTAVRLMHEAYRDLVRLPSAQHAFHELYRGLLDEERRPALFHCTTGKDRTGWASAALLLLLGVDEGDVEREYLLTNEQLLPALQSLFDRFAAAGGNPEALRPVLGVDVAYLRTALDEVRSRFGSIEGYFADGLGLDAATQARLREALTEPAD